MILSYYWNQYFIAGLLILTATKRMNYFLNKTTTSRISIKLTIEISPTKFLDAQLVNLNGKIKKIERKANKLPVPWSWNIPKSYKRNAMNGDLHRAKRIATDFEKEIVQIKEKFLAANFPSRLINSVCNDFLNTDNNQKNIDFIIPPGFFHVKPPVFLTFNIVIKMKLLLNSLSKSLTNLLMKNMASWKMKIPFKLKDPCIHSACKIYKGVCICGEIYIKETIHNVETRWKEHNTPSEKSSPSQHINNHGSHF